MNKVKMTKTLPDSVGIYFRCDYEDGRYVEIVEVYMVVYREGQIDGKDKHFAYDDDNNSIRVDLFGGFWAKVDPSMFEFEV